MKIMLIIVTNAVIVVALFATFGIFNKELFTIIKLNLENSANIIETINFQWNIIDIILFISNKFPEIRSLCPSNTIEIAEEIEKIRVHKITDCMRYKYKK